MDGSRPGRRAQSWLALLGAACLALACGNAQSGGGLVSRDLQTPGDELESSNGMSTNGMSTNGMSTNGMSTNGMQGNGLNFHGSASSSISSRGLTNETLQGWMFDNWFRKNPVYADMVMTYIVRCAVPAGQTRRYYSSSSGNQYRWQGVLGLLPSWSAGAPISTLEQETLSACLAAHANRFGVHVDFSILGYGADGSLIPLDDSEQSDYPIPEGAFFGNLYNGGQVYSCSQSTTSEDGVSGPRECAMADMPSDVCAPMVNTQSACADICEGADLPGIGWLWLTCTAPDGRSYPALNTSVSSDDIYWCGDGQCQFTESCYDEQSGTGCLQDCGSCN